MTREIVGGGLRAQHRQTADRTVWIDVAKGVCMVLVVLMHCSLWLETQFNDGSGTWWWQVSVALSPLRMPLFFFVSGYLVARALRRPLHASRARTWGFLYIYVLWTGLFLARLYLPGAGSKPEIWHVIAGILLPTSFWYLWALAFFFVITWVAVRLLGRYAPWLIVAFVALALLAPVIDATLIPLVPRPVDALKFGTMAANLVWYYAGSQFRSLWDALMRRATATSAVLVSALFATVATAEVHQALPRLLPLTSALALVAAAQVLAVVPLQTVVGRLLARVGRLTLPVYIFHIFVISALSATAKAMGIDGWIIDHIAAVGVLLPPILTVGIIWVSMLVGRWILRSPLRWTLSPDWLSSRSSNART